ncbi:MAG: ATP-binding cassette domain-containing protein, partial [Gemmatimonadota bacterium]
LTLGLTGPTGGGKTTLISLLPRLYEPERGVVELDGHPVGDYRLDALRAAVALAPQEPFLFSQTLRANLAFGAPDAAPGGPPSAPLTLEAAAALAGLEPDLTGFPAGLDTIVGERGITLSGGQKQRAALARALLANPRVLVLDDAFSSVDTETEERILSRLRAVFATRTTILISHRASTLRHAHRIVVLDGGRIVEDGTPDELLAREGWYAALHRRQQLEAELERA